MNPYDIEHPGAASAESHSERFTARGSDPVGEAKEVGKEKLAQAQGAAREVTEEAVHKGRETLEDQRRAAAGQIHGVASALRAAADRFAEQDQDYMAGLAGRAAETIEGMSDSIDRQDMADLMHRLQHFTQRQPALVLGGAVATGLILARFFTASRRDSDYEWRERYPRKSRVSPAATGTAAPSEYRAPTGGLR
jgi:hypothetical protein